MELLDDDRPTVRPALVSDAEAIARIHVRSWQVAYRGMIPDGYLGNLTNELDSRIARWRLQVGQPDPRALATFVAEASDGSLVGWATIGENRDEDEPDPTTGELWGIYVDPDRWREQAGSVLMHRCLERLTDAAYGQATLWVLEANKRARSFYERWGWRPDGGSEWFSREDFRVIEVRYRRPLP